MDGGAEHSVWFLIRYSGEQHTTPVSSFMVEARRRGADAAALLDADFGFHGVDELTGFDA